MKIINDLKSLKNSQLPCVATIGNFDGLHLGHQTILANLKEKAKELNLPLTVISFEPLPTEYFMLEPPARIYPLRDKIKRMSSLGVDNFLCLKFDEKLASTDPTDFIENILIKSLNVKYLSVGDDFRFGYKRGGGFNLLQSVGEANGMVVEDTKTQLQEGHRISSTRIRQALDKGDIETANSLLGHSYKLSGRIRHGDKRGRTIGFPTINMKVPEHIASKLGVYAVIVHGLTEAPLNGVSNLGIRPTVNGKENRLETHIFDFNADVYSKYICVEFKEFIRGEKQFDNFEALKKQIIMDAETAKAILVSE
ncbi:MAG: riboflavin kinase/FMN adenylyltransferase [Cocleimonas sp.]|jgi:riboflavin kinase/FMN adenylyltransferase